MARRRASSFASDFWAFINRGNVIELATAVIIGTAFGQVVNSIVNLLMSGLLNPVLENLGVNRLRDWPAGEVIVNVINFLVISLVVYLIIKSIERFKRKQEAEEAAPDPILTQQQLAVALDRLSSALETRRL